MARYKTEQRKLMKDLFVKHPHEIFSANEIAEMLSEHDISISAIYRNLAELEASGLVRRCAKNGSRKGFYQYTGIETCKDHIHLTCRKCGKTIHMKPDDTLILVQSVSKYKNFVIDKTETVLYGICGACQNN